jgi:glycosyltransferase involved in cell wall biosynthesis
MILPYQTGVGRYLLGLFEGFSQLSINDQYEFWIQSGLPKDHPIKNISAQNIIVDSLSLPHMSLRAFSEIPLKLIKKNPDLFHYPHFDLPWSVPGPVVATIHDLKYISQPKFFPRIRSLKRIVMFLMMYFTAHRAKIVIVDSNSTASDIQNHFKIPNHKISIIPLGVDFRFFHLSDQLPEQKFSNNFFNHYGIDKPYLLFVGERRPHKNLLTLIKAFSIFKNKVGQSYRLIIAGRSYADYQEPEKLVEELGLNREVIFLDYFPDDDLPFLYQKATAFISLSYYEGFGLPALEAMASRTPVIVSDNTSFPEVVSNAGITVPPNQEDQVVDALLQVMPGRELRTEYITRGFQRAQTFTWLQCAKMTRAVYQQAVFE